MNTTQGTVSSPAGSRFARLLLPVLALTLFLAFWPAPAAAQTAALSVANESPNSFNCDVYRWRDSAGQQRTAALSRNTAADPGGSRGGVLYQYRFTPTGSTTERVITGTGSHSYNGFGYVVNHYSDTAYVSTGTTGTWSSANTGAPMSTRTRPSSASVSSITPRCTCTRTVRWSVRPRSRT